MQGLGLGFRVQGLGLGLRVQGLGFRVKELGLFAYRPTQGDISKDSQKPVP